MNEGRAAVLRQQRLEELCAASLRALAGDAELHLRLGRAFRGSRALAPAAPHLHTRLDDADFAAHRAAADGMALRVLRADARLHASLAPADAVERLVFEMLEQFRVESLVPEGLPGVRHNLRRRFEAWSRAFLGSALAESERALLLFALAQAARSRIVGDPVLEAVADLIESSRGALSARTGPAMGALRRVRDDQAAYAQLALAVARSVAAMLAERGDAGDDGARERPADAAANGAFAFFIDFDAPLDDGIATAQSGASRVLAEAADGYRIFTRDYDRVLEPATLVRREQLRALRERLDARIAAQGANGPRLARELKALLGAPANDGWDGGQEEGRIDGQRLPLLIASPAERRLFRAERTEPRADAVVTFLIDCSGSMKQHIEAVAMLVDVLVRALEQAGAANEVLGFTTNAWNGGRAARDWQRLGAPPHPGRLNESCHLVFKDADTTWRRARPGIAALLKSDLFREGIDGEAVDWACARLAMREASRRHLLVISDGSPMDSATARANDDAFYLDHHLRHVVQAHERRGLIDIAGIGVGLDLSPYYSRCRALDLAAPPGDRVFAEVLQLLAGAGRR